MIICFVALNQSLTMVTIHHVTVIFIFRPYFKGQFARETSRYGLTNIIAKYNLEYIWLSTM